MPTACEILASLYFRLGSKDRFGERWRRNAKYSSKLATLESAILGADRLGCVMLNGLLPKGFSAPARFPVVDAS
jgi:hypothetical protein